MPLLVGTLACCASIVIHALPLGAIIHVVRREQKLGRAGSGFWVDMSIVLRAVVYALAAHLVEIALWAGIFVACGEFHQFGLAYYHSAVNYTTLGYGDIVMSPKWKLLGPLEAADGMLMFGVSTAMVFAVIQRLVEDRYTDLRE